ncbi:MAG: hypothetical protein KatS3mg051_0679 [Anaerolineae bacterium]|nr:MAG: hypothetical protein KatS3mg051_0679 [Anaerolineae bacterium]
MFQALLAYSGANDWIYHYILDSDWKWRALTPQMGVNCPPFCRFPEEGKAYEHTLFGNTFQMWEVAEQRQVNDGIQVRGLRLLLRARPRRRPRSGHLHRLLESAPGHALAI